jgi:NAD(P)-dependent dehydrogenase (short-subunit alcohol dehydrogenase family)
VSAEKLLASLGLTVEEVREAARVLEAIVGDRGLLAGIPHEDRVRLLTAAGRIAFPSPLEARRLVKTFRRNKKQAKQDADRGLRAETGIRAARVAPVFVAPARVEALPASPGAEAPARELKTPKSCYVCKAEFRRLHFFYDAMCPDCAAFNYEKRFQAARLDGRVALITGSRLKIGYQAALKMLRAGATVIATTRFPHDSAARYAREADFEEWKDRLHVHGLDLRHAPSVELFCRFVEQRWDRLDVLVNNAAQTVRRPPGFYAHLLDFESMEPRALSVEIRPLLRDHEECVQALSSAPALAAGDHPFDGGGLFATDRREPERRAERDSLPRSERGVWGVRRSTPQLKKGAGIGIRASAAMSQLAYAFDESEMARGVFPEGERDADLQQVDLRTRNTWRLTLAEVATPELLEVQLINAVAPFILCSRLKGLMTRQPSRDKHIVNVSAMEGVFSRGTKTDKHPHTNMAKAALNMMTLTSARDYVLDGIHMNAVDTGWVTDEDPAVHAQRKKEELDFQPPLDVVDGAARVCDPFFSGLLTGEHGWGRFLKDYKPSSW